jgi:hypothetical protein
VTVPLGKVVSEARSIIAGSVEEIAEYQFANARNKLVTTRYFVVRVEEVVKSRESGSTNHKGSRIALVDPQELFYQEHADLIAAGVISFVDRNYPTKVAKIAVGDRLLFFLAGGETARNLRLPDARFLVCGHAYDTFAVKHSVLKQLK